MAAEMTSVVIILLVVQTALVNVIQHRLMEASVGLHPIIVLLARLAAALRRLWTRAESMASTEPG